MEKYGETLEDRISLIKKHSTGMRTADVILTTAHKSKGLEFVSVVIDEDFIPLFDKNGMLIPEERIELELNNDLENLINT